MNESTWNNFLIEGDKLFYYLCNHYSDLFDPHGNYDRSILHIRRYEIYHHDLSILCQLMLSLFVML